MLQLFVQGVFERGRTRNSWVSMGQNAESASSGLLRMDSVSVGSGSTVSPL